MSDEFDIGDIDFGVIDAEIESVKNLSIGDAETEQKEDPKSYVKNFKDYETIKKESTESLSKQIFIYHYIYARDFHMYTNKTLPVMPGAAGITHWRSPQFIKFKGFDKKLEGTVAIHRFQYSDSKKKSLYYIYDDFENLKNDVKWKDDGFLCYVFKERFDVSDKVINPFKQMLYPLILMEERKAEIPRYKLHTERKEEGYMYNKLLGYVFLDDVDGRECTEFETCTVYEQKYEGDHHAYLQISTEKQTKSNSKNYGSTMPIFRALGLPVVKIKTIGIWQFQIKEHVYSYGVIDSMKIKPLEFVCRLCVEQQKNSIPIYLHKSEDSAGSCKMSTHESIKAHKLVKILGYAYSFDSLPLF